MKFVLPILACFGLFVASAFAAPTSQPTTQPSITVGNISVTSSPSGAKAVFTVSINAAVLVPVVVNYATVAGTASSGNGDYLGIPSGSVVIAAGQTTATVSVAIKPHATLDGPKTFQLSVTASVPTTVEVSASGVGTSMSNNFCGGNWENPVITADRWKKGVGFSGSEFMVADPGGDLNLTTGTNIDASGNIGIDCENQGVVMAYGYGNRMWDNLVVKDGTGSTFGTEPAQIFNWSVKKDVGATPVNLFATNTQFYGNQYNWLVEGKPIDPIIDSKVDQSLAPNTQVNTTQAQARALWQANVQAMTLTIGPK